MLLPPSVLEQPALAATGAALPTLQAFDEVGVVGSARQRSSLSRISWSAQRFRRQARRRSRRGTRHWATCLFAFGGTRCLAHRRNCTYLLRVSATRRRPRLVLLSFEALRMSRNLSSTLGFLATHHMVLNFTGYLLRSTEAFPYICY